MRETQDMPKSPFQDEPSPSTSINRRRFGRAVAGGMLALPAILAPTSSAVAQQARGQARTAYDLIVSAKLVSIFSEAIRKNGAEAEFRAAGRFGFFVPLDSAVEKLPAAQLERFRSDKEFARQLLFNHITDFSGAITIFGKPQESSWETRNVRTKAGRTVPLVTGGGPARIGSQPVVYSNIRASNGMCHAIDGVLMV